MISECSETMLVGIVDSATVYPSEKKIPLHEVKQSLSNREILGLLPTLQ